MAYTWGTVASAGASATSGAAVTVSVTYAAGDRVQVWITYGSAVTLTETISDGTNTYTKIGSSQNLTADTQTYSLYECLSAAAGTFTLSFTPGAPVAFRAVCAFNQAGLDTVTTAQTASNQQATPGTGTDAITSTTLTPASQPGMIVGMSADDGGTTSAINSGTGFTGRGTIANWDSGIGIKSRVEDLRLTATTAKATTFTAASTPGICVTFAAFIPESGGAPAVVLGAFRSLLGVGK